MKILSIGNSFSQDAQKWLHAIALAEKLRSAFERKGYSYLVPNRTNQIFVVMQDENLDKLLSLNCKMLIMIVYIS